jgi:hypothetical protein
MADVSALFGILLFLGLVFPGLLSAVWLIFPATVQRARLRLERTPWQCFWLGGVLTAFIAIPTTILMVLPSGAARFLGFSVLAIVLTIASVGAAGLASKMAGHLALFSRDLSPASAFLRATLALEFAAAFPLVGWFIIMPLAAVVSLGATAFALLKWMPRVAPLPPGEGTGVRAEAQPRVA